MANVTLKFNIDVSQAKASLQGFRKALQGLQIGQDISASLTEQINKIEEKMKDLEKFQITPKTDDATLKQFKVLIDDIQKSSKNVEDSFGKINHELREVTGESSRSFEKMKNIQNIIQGTQQTYAQTRQTLAEELKERDKKLQLAQLEGRIAVEQNEKTRESLVTTLERKQQDQERLDILEKIKVLEGKHKKDMKDLRLTEDTAKTLHNQLQKHEEIQQALEKKKAAYRDLDTQARTAEQSRKDGLEAQKQSLDAVSKQIGGITDRMKRLIEFTVAAFALRQLRRFIQEGLGFIRDLDKSLTEIATVTHQTRQAMWQMAEEFNRMGRELGKTTNEIAQASVIFYRQGLQTHQVLEMVRASTISASIARPNFTAIFKASLFNTGKVPGKAKSYMLAWVLGSAPNSMLEPEKSFEFVANCTWTSRPITVSHSMFISPESEYANQWPVETDEQYLISEIRKNSCR